MAKTRGLHNPLNRAWLSMLLRGFVRVQVRTCIYVETVLLFLFSRCLPPADSSH